MQDLNVNTFVIASMISERNDIRYFVAKIMHIDNEEILVNYLKQDFDHPDLFTDSVSKKDNNCSIQINEIVMLLAMPVIPRRGGRYLFNAKINLNK